MIEKLEKDGKVAVIISTDFGAGWSTWVGENAEQAAFDPEIAQAILDGKSIAEITEIAERKYPKGYKGGLEDGLEVEWVEKNTPFLIHEYDGAESIWYTSDLTYTA